MDIVVKELCKSYDGKKVFDGLSAVFKEGNITCIMGQSGCGKTTLLRLLMGLEKPDSGEIDGMSPLISAVFQEDRLCEDFSAFANVRLCADKSLSKADIERQLSEVGLSQFIYRPVSSFSGGMKRRVAIVRAMAAKSDVVFLDEAFKGLDDDLRIKTVEYVKAAAKGRTVLSVTHSSDEAALMNADIFNM